MPYFVLAKKSDSGKLYMKSHRRSDEAVNGVEITLDPDVKKALLFSSAKTATERARTLSSDISTFIVEPVTPSAKIGDMVDDSTETAALPTKTEKVS